MKPFIASVLKNWGDAVGKSTSSGFHFYVPLFISCVTSGKWRNLSVPRFRHLQSGNDILLGLFWEKHMRGRHTVTAK